MSKASNSLSSASTDSALSEEEKSSLRAKKKEVQKKYEFLEDLLDDRGSSPVQSYQESGRKERGVSSGFVGKKASSTYMLKSGEIEVDNSAPYNHTPAADKRDVMSEYITAALYERILKDRAPKIGLALDNSPGHKNIYIKSKFHKDFESVKDYKAKPPASIRALATVTESNPLKDGEIAFAIVNDKMCWKKEDGSITPLKLLPDEQENEAIHQQYVPRLIELQAEALKTGENLDDFYRREYQQLTLIQN